MNGIETHRLLGAGCGKSRTSGSEGEVHHSNVDIDSNRFSCNYSGLHFGVTVAVRTVLAKERAIL